MLYLASQSPRRRQLLEQIGATFRVVRVDVPEVRADHESPEDYVRRVARDKACAGRDALDEDDAWVLGSDTEVVLGDEVFGKPETPAQACGMLKRLAGVTHRVISSVWLVHAEREESATCISHVRLASMSEKEIDAYVETGESFGKAGGYAIQGRAAAYVEYLSGSYSAVMGLPLHETAVMLSAAGLWASGRA
ncbi:MULTISPECIES: Maf family protein [Oleiagrimonas]|uniref:dTTP/UTP pyrophosphatase n=1 Tax=Oleiagrimonas citrea TaxID=1665687 RepID=A0A846ZIX5_9GAMM|nr:MULTISPECIES: Maf family protein [Oleiagrimonas]NKZ37956.1 septum formation inhibitor Maf [Oleiagrimonas citrea]RAP57448.1 septum formation inhibitor Maf [Oleiagrimonas sp. MCCC 1A03011]